MWLFLTLVSVVMILTCFVTWGLTIKYTLVTVPDNTKIGIRRKASFDLPKHGQYLNKDLEWLRYEHFAFDTKEEAIESLKARRDKEIASYLRKKKKFKKIKL